MSDCNTEDGYLEYDIFAKRGSSFLLRYYKKFKNKYQNYFDIKKCLKLFEYYSGGACFPVSFARCLIVILKMDFWNMTSLQNVETVFFSSKMIESIKMLDIIQIQLDS